MEEAEGRAQDKKLNKFTNWLLVVSFLILVFGIGYKLGENKTKLQNIQNLNFNQKNNQNTTDLKENSANLDLFWTVWNTLKVKYVDQQKIKQEEMLYGAIKGMVASLKDPYTYFLTPSENKASKDDLGGLYEGIGAQLGMKDNNVIVVAPLKGSPALEAGIKSGDYIVKVNKELTKGLTLAEVVNKIRGKAGTKVKLTLMRKNVNPIELELERKAIRIESVELSYKSLANCKNNCAQVAYLKISQFGDNTNSGFDKAALEIRAKYDKNQIKGMVMDLRSNPGGYLESSVHLSSEFLSYGQQIVKQEYADKSGKDYTSLRNGILQNIPLTILIDNGSASAAEILSGALRDQGKAILVGQKSFGKGSVQEAMDLTGGAGLHVTIAKWILPKGDWINGKGIEPDIKVENKIIEGNTTTDETDDQLQKAIEKIVE